MYKVILAVVLLAFSAFAIPVVAQPRPTQSCNQTLDRCVADRVALGSKPMNAHTRCAEILARCKKR